MTLKERILAARKGRAADHGSLRTWRLGFPVPHLLYTS
jgi:hypothetical protein